MTSAQHRAARQYVPRAIPLKPRAKTPVVAEWPSKRPTREMVDWWWTQNPAYNVGIICGDGLVVLDVDPRTGADDDLADLEHEYGELPETVTCETGSGGLHFYFAGPKDLPTWFISAGLEVRSEKAQVVAPPSIHPNGNTYRWRKGCAPGQIPRAPLPQWILDLQPKSDGAARPVEHWVQEFTRDIHEGARREAMVRFAGHLLRKYVDVQVVFALLSDHNAVRCKPPLPIAELEQVVDSLHVKEIRRRAREGRAAA